MLRRLVKTTLWYLKSPRYLARITNSKWRRLATACHPTARVNLSEPPLLGASVSIGRYTTIICYRKGKLVLGDGVWIGDGCEIGILGSVRIGQGTSLQHGTQLHGDVDIGAGCTCAANLYIASTSHRYLDEPSLPIRWQDARAMKNWMPEYSRPVVVEEDCWLGINVVICPGVTVGRGSVVGANSVVTSNVPPYSVIAGTPARLIKQRLVYEPPAAIFANRSEDVPYFYSGFLVPEFGSDWGVAAMNGRSVHPKFALALNAKEGNVLQLKVSAELVLKLKHHCQEILLPLGTSIVSVNGVSDARGLFWFEVVNWKRNCLSVHSAWLSRRVSVEGNG